MSTHPDTARLKRFYAKYAPEKTDADVAATLDKFGGSPEMLAKMWAGLEKKYGPEPAADTAVHPDTARLKRFYAKYAPEKTDADVKATLDKFGGSPEMLAKMWAGLTKKYGPEELPPASSTPVTPPTPSGSAGVVYTVADTERLKRFYAKYAPEKTDADVKATLDKFGTNQETLAKMWGGLTKKYGPEPPSPAPTPSGTASSGAQDSAGKVYTEADTARLRRFYAKYAPEKTEADVKATLDKFGDTNENLAKMWAGLTRKYGPEPGGAGTPVPPSTHQSGRATPATALSPSSRTSAADQPDAYSEEKVKLRLKRYYLKYDPTYANDTDVSDMYNKHLHAAGGHQAMFAALGARYGPEPSLEEFLPDAQAAIDLGGSAQLRASVNKSKDATIAGSTNNNSASNNGDQSSTPHRPSRFLPTVRPPAALVEETISHKRRAEALRRSELEAKNRIVCCQMSIRLFGADYMVYELASMDAQKRFRTAFEIDISLHIKIAPKFVRVVRVGAVGGIVLDVDIDVPEDEELVAAATNPSLEPYERTTLQERRTKEFQLKESSIKILLDELADAILCGRFRLTNTRASFRDDLGGNPVAVYAQSIILDGVNVADFRREQQSQSARFPGSSLVVSLNNPAAIEAQQRALLLAQFGGNTDSPQYQLQLRQLVAAQQQMRALTNTSGVPGGLASSIEASPPRYNEVIIEGESMHRNVGGDVSVAGEIVEHSHFGLLAGVPIDPSNPAAAAVNRSSAPPNAEPNKPKAPNFLNQLWFDPNTPGAQQIRHNPDGSSAASPPSRYDFHRAEAPDRNNTHLRGFGDAQSVAAHRVTENQSSQPTSTGVATDRDAHIANLMNVIHQQNKMENGEGGSIDASPAHPSGMPVSPQGVVYGFHPEAAVGISPHEKRDTFTLSELQQLSPEELAQLLSAKKNNPPSSTESLGNINLSSSVSKPISSPPPQPVPPTTLHTSSNTDTSSGQALSVGELYHRLHSYPDPSGSTRNRSRGGTPVNGGNAYQGIQGRDPTSLPVLQQRAPSVTEGVQTSRIPTPQISPRTLEEQKRQREAQQQQTEFIQNQSAQQTQILQMIAEMQRQQLEMQQAHQREREQAQLELLKQQQKQEAQLQAQIIQQQQQFQQYQQQMAQYQQYQQQVAAANQSQSLQVINAANMKADTLQNQLEHQQVQHRLMHQQYQSAYTDHYNFNKGLPPNSEDTRLYTLPDASIGSNATQTSVPRQVQAPAGSAAAVYGSGGGKRASFSLVPPSMQGYQFN